MIDRADKEYNDVLLFLYKISGSIKQVFGFFRGPGGFRELREAYRKLFHLSWYLLVPGVTSYDQI